MNDINWHMETEETDDYIEEMALADYNGLSLGISAKFVPKQLYGEIEGFMTEQNLTKGKCNLLFCYKKKYIGFPDVVEPKLQRATGEMKKTLERLAHGEDL